VPAGSDDFALLRRGALWAQHHYDGVRLAESAWTINTSLPRIDVEDGKQWRLYEHCKGGKPRAIPLLSNSRLRRANPSSR
jgi:hypothetical protein